MVITYLLKVDSRLQTTDYRTQFWWKMYRQTVWQETWRHFLCDPYSQTVWQTTQRCFWGNLYCQTVWQATWRPFSGEVTSTVRLCEKQHGGPSQVRWPLLSYCVTSNMEALLRWGDPYSQTVWQATWRPFSGDVTPTVRLYDKHHGGPSQVRWPYFQTVGQATWRHFSGEVTPTVRLCDKHHGGTSQVRWPLMSDCVTSNKEALLGWGDPYCQTVWQATWRPFSGEVTPTVRLCDKQHGGSSQVSIWPVMAHLDLTGNGLLIFDPLWYI